MKFIVNSQYFAQELRLLDKIISPKTPHAVLKNILFVVTDKLTMTATDLEVGLKTSCGANLIEPGTVTLPSQKLLSIIEQLPDCDVEITTSEEGHVFLNAGMFKSRIQTLPASEYPTMPEVEGDIISAPLEVLQRLIARTRFAIADKGAKYAVDGALLSVAENKAAMIATNGKSLAMAVTPWNGNTKSNLIIPTKALDVLTTVAGNGNIDISTSDNHLFFTVEHRVLFSRKLEATFPSFQRVIPKANDKIIDVNRAQFAAVLRRVGMMSEEKTLGVVINVSSNLLKASSKSNNMGDAEEELLTNYTGDEVAVQANWKFLIDFLDVAVGDKIQIALKDASSAILLTDGQDFLTVIAPMRY